MDVTAHEGLKRLAVGKLDVKPATVTFDQAEGVQLAFVPLIIKHTKVTPIDLEAVTGTGFDTDECARNAGNLTERFQVTAQNRDLARKSQGAETLGYHDGTGLRVSLDKLANQRLEVFEFGLAGFSGSRDAGGRKQVLLDRLTGDVKFACDPAHRPFFLMLQPVNSADLIWIHDHRRIPSFDGPGIARTGAAGTDGCSLQDHAGLPLDAASD